MGPSSHEYPINEPYLLWLIREGRLCNVEDVGAIARRRTPRPSDFSADDSTINDRPGAALQEEMLRIIRGFAAAGLVEFDGDTIRPTALILEMQAALGIGSLRHLARLYGDSILVELLFGPPSTPAALVDILVLMPSAPELTPLYERHIKKTVGRLGLTARRGNDFFTEGSIIAEFWNAICDSRLIVADCTGRSPHVFYGIGLAHTVGQPTVLVAQSPDDVPLDLQHVPWLVYNCTEAGLRAFERELGAVVRAELTAGGRRGPPNK